MDTWLQVGVILFVLPLIGTALGRNVSPTVGGTAFVLTNLPGSPFTTIPGQFAGQFDQSGTHLFTYKLTGYSVLTVDPNTGIPTNPTPDLSVTSTPFFAVTQ